MLSTHTLDRLASNGDFDRTLSLVLTNGREVPLAVRLRLSDDENLPGAALGLALVRSVELARSPDGVPSRLAHALLERADPHGSFGGVVGTAAAVSGLLNLLACADGGAFPLDSELERRAYSAVRAALRWLGCRQSMGVPALFAPVEEGEGAEGNEECEGFGRLGDALDSAIVLWLFAGHVREAAEEIRVNDLFTACVKDARHDADVRRMLALTGQEERPVGSGKPHGRSRVASAA